MEQNNKWKEGGSSETKDEDRTSLYSHVERRWTSELKDIYEGESRDRRLVS
jgi:hypothetical protein